MVSERLQLLQSESSFSTLSFSYKPVANYMTSPVITINTEKTLLDASRIMSENKIGSIIVTGKNDKFAGLITSKHIVHEILPRLEETSLKSPVKDFLESNPITVPKEYPLVEVLAELQARNKDYAVITEENTAKGIISNKDILKILYRNVHIYNLHIEQASTKEELKNIFRELGSVAAHLLENTRQSSEILPVLSDLHLSIKNKIYKITVDEYRNNTGKDATEITHSVIIMGSGARKEMFLDPDQDNGFIFEDNITKEDKTTLMEFGEHLVNNFDYVGYRKCPGNIMVTNPDMSKTLSEWKNSITEIFNNPGKTGFLTSSIIFDMDCFYGSEQMVWELKNLILKLIAEKPIFLIQLLEKDSNQRIPLSIFGKFQVEKEGEHTNQLNLKMSALTFIVDVTRVFALSKQLNDLNTVERLKHLRRKNILSEETVQNVLSAYETVVDILMNEQINKSKRNYTPDKYVNPYKLSLLNQNKLKEAFNTISKYLSTGIKYYKGHP